MEGREQKWTQSFERKGGRKENTKKNIFISRIILK
jgi:hypothetical protein